MAQSDDRWEQIIVDDGSTDGTLDIALSYDDPRIRVISQDHVGIWRLGDTYNKALGAARGAFVAVLEGDDFWPADKLALQLASFDNADNVLTWGQAGHVDESGNLIGLHLPHGELARLVAMSQTEAVRALLKRCYIIACTAMFRRQALIAAGGFLQPPGIPNVDYPTYLQVSRQGRIVGQDDILGFWRQHQDQVTSRLTDEMARNASWGSLFIGQLSVDERSAMGILPEEAVQIERHRTANTELFKARRLMRSGHVKDAKGCLVRALKKGNASIRGKALVLLAYNFMQIDVEGTIQMRNRLRVLFGRLRRK